MVNSEYGGHAGCFQIKSLVLFSIIFENHFVIYYDMIWNDKIPCAKSRFYKENTFKAVNFFSTCWR